MIDSSPDCREAAVSERRSRWLERGVLWAVCALVIGVYASVAQSGALESLTANAADTYYNLLVRGFRAGQLSLKKEVPPGLAQLADPYDTGANAPYRSEPYRMHDLSYYKGRVYLYWGVPPALLLFWPYTALTGHYLFHRQAVAIFCALGFLASVGLLHALWRRYFAKVSIWAVAACALALGLATGLPVLLSRSDVYEVPISCGYMLTMLAIGALWRAVHAPEPRKLSAWLTSPVAWLALASLAYGLAVGARPNLLFGAVILLVPVVQAWRERRPVWALLAAAVVPITLIGLGLMLYNDLRFENPFEFGLHYQLASGRQDTLLFFNLGYVWFNIRVFFLEPARWNTQFPFVHEIAVPVLPPGRGPIESPFGVLTTIPLVWLALAAPLAWRGRSTADCSILRQFVAVVALVFGIDAVVLCLFRGTNFRYEVEFLPAFVLLSVVGVIGLECALATPGAWRAPKAFGDGSPRSERGRPVWRRVARCGWVSLLGFSVAFNLLVGVEGYALAHYHRGNALLQAGKVQDAIEEYERALRIKPDYAEPCNNLGLAFHDMGQSENAIRQFEQALRIKPDYAEAYNNLGTVEFGLGNVTEAMEHYEQALRLKPDFAEAHYNLGMALEQVVVITANGYPDQESPYNLGMALDQVGRVQKAIGHYEQVLRLRPDFAEAKNRLATLEAWLARQPPVR